MPCGIYEIADQSTYGKNTVLKWAAVRRGIAVPPGYFNSDMEIWDQITELINKHGYQNKIGIQIDIASDMYFEKETGKFEGLFSKKPMTHDELLKFLINMSKQWPFVILEDPLSEDDYELTAAFTKAVDIQVVGDDLFTTNPARERKVSRLVPPTQCF